MRSGVLAAAVLLSAGGAATVLPGRRVVPGTAAVPRRRSAGEKLHRRPALSRWAVVAKWAAAAEPAARRAVAAAGLPLPARQRIRVAAPLPPRSAASGEGANATAAAAAAAALRAYEGVAYWAEVGIGDPQQKIGLIVDTGSALTVVPTRECAKAGACLRSANYPEGYYSAGASAATTKCDCGSSKKPCFDDALKAGSSGPCAFTMQYADGTTVEGDLYIDNVTLGGSSARFRFGRVLRTAPFGPAAPALAPIGIMGLLPPSDVTLCLPSCGDDAAEHLAAHKGGFTMRLGRSEPDLSLGHPAEGSVTAPVIHTFLEDVVEGKFYTVCLAALRVDGNEFGSADLTSWAAATIIDSGTSLAYIPQSVYSELRQRLQTKERCKIPGICGTRSVFTDGWMWESDFQRHKAELPDISFVLDGMTLTLHPEDYMLAQDADPAAGGAAAGKLRLFGIQPSPVAGGVLAFSLLGDVLMRPFAVHFNPTTGAVSFAGPAVERTGARSCSTEPAPIRSWYLPVGFALGGAAVLLAAGLMHLASQLCLGGSQLTAAVCLVAAVISAVALFWLPSELRWYRFEAVLKECSASALLVVTIALCIQFRRTCCCCLPCCRARPRPVDEDPEVRQPLVAPSPIQADDRASLSSAHAWGHPGHRGLE
eukprot:TRINITY_DN60141_c0_g1_i1.p1 TRINITY_DN60141_c0_g1~~TRINITY_DN60141_c0_g1_i1.p1  ORF type:complete len:678 (+),score=165.25 TRINITY_DN60141_c0_g1_i1:84-2036(+)